MFQKLLEKNEPFKRLIMPHRLYVGVLAFQNGVSVLVIPLSWCSRAFKSVIGSQLVRCAIYAPKTPDGASRMLALPVPVCGQAVKKSHTWGIVLLRRSSRMYFGV